MLCTGCYSSLRLARSVLNDDKKRGMVNEALSHIQMEYHGSAQVHHFTSVIADKGEGTIRSMVAQPLEGFMTLSRPGCHMARPDTTMNPEDSFVPKVLDDLSTWSGALPVKASGKYPCCGGGISSESENISSSMLNDVTSEAKASCATHIITACPFCFLQLDIRQKSGLPVLFVSEMLALAFGASPESIGMRYHRTKRCQRANDLFLYRWLMDIDNVKRELDGSCRMSKTAH